MKITDNQNRTSVFIVPRASTDWRGNEAGWITCSGWAGAGKLLWGHAVVATTDGVFSPIESMTFPRGITKKNQVGGWKKAFRRVVPEFLITGYKDFKLWKSKPVTWPIESCSDIENRKVMLVWQRHDLFPGPGRRLANLWRVPLVISVEAPAVWEARKWGVKRPFWGGLLERHVEAESLKSADLVSCVSEEVRERVIELGVPPDKAIVSHNRVDSLLFNPTVDGSLIRQKFGLTNKKVIGWIGSFRSFHGVDDVVAAFNKVRARHPMVVLMLVGDGLEFDKIERMVNKLGLKDCVTMPGRQKFIDIPSFIAGFDVAITSAKSASGFHYSPLKLREYLACGKATIAPRAGNLPELFQENVDVLFYDPGNIDQLADKISNLLEDDRLHLDLTSRAVTSLREETTWLFELKKVCHLLGIQG